jgi:hypothetical protein
MHAAGLFRCPLRSRSLGRLPHHVRTSRHCRPGLSGFTSVQPAQDCFRSQVVCFGAPTHF